MSGTKKELLTWHWDLVIAMTRIQEMTRKRKIEEPPGKISILPPIINPKFHSTPKCVIYFCASCQIPIAKKRSPEVGKRKLVYDKKKS